MRSKQKKPYKGVLKTRIQVDAAPKPPNHFQIAILPEVNLEDAYKQEKRKYEEQLSEDLANQLTKKMAALFDHYKIDLEDENCWEQLSYKLAHAHVPGFQIRNKDAGGRPKSWEFDQYAKLYVDVNILLIEKSSIGGYNLSRACGELSKSPEWQGYQKKTLQNKYSEAEKSPLVLVIKHLLKQVPQEDYADFFAENLMILEKIKNLP